MHTFVLAGGCFWCLDAVYRTLRGVKDVVSGYTGGATAYPDYDSVCSGRTGHAEAVEVTFDPDVIPDQVILDVFFSLHDPRQLNRQGNDVGTQYRSAMFYADAAQKQLFEEAIARAAEV
ncbi:MAG: peptide-methionine (S)-S-oxide reductase MsrA, partial [Rhodoglobus sp.]